VDDPALIFDTPAHLVRGLESRIGTRETAAWCGDLLAGRARYDDVDRPSLSWLGSGDLVATAARLEAKGFGYWPRVWGARGLLHCWAVPPDRAVVAAVASALADPAWRVREMAAKVVARHEVGAAADALLPCTGDEVPRVRAAAVRALAAVGEPEQTDYVVAAVRDDDPAVRRAAERAVGVLDRRLDRPV